MKQDVQNTTKLFMHGGNTIIPRYIYSMICVVIVVHSQVCAPPPFLIPSDGLAILENE